MSIVMIVDDSRVARLSLRRLIGGILPDATLLEAGSAEEAMEVSQGQEISMAIIDYNMPGKSGLDLAEMLHQSMPSLRMALCTANIQDALAERARNMGMAFIPKPPDAAVLEAFLKEETA